MVRDFQERDEPLGWFESIYTDAEGDHKAVFWADLEASPYLTEWLESHPLNGKMQSAIAIEPSSRNHSRQQGQSYLASD